jgi:hypothetical protein
MTGISVRVARNTDRCDTHTDRVAVVRVTGGDAYADVPALCCQQCYEKLKDKQIKSRQRPCNCDWCHNKKEDVRPFKDREGNRDGITSNVCGDCRRAYIEKELTNDFIPGRRKTRSIKEQEETLVSEEAAVDNNDDELLDED